MLFAAPWLHVHINISLISTCLIQYLCTDVDAALDFLCQYHFEELLDRIVTGDRTWIMQILRQSSNQCNGDIPLLQASQIKPIELSARKVMATVFWDAKGI